MATNGVIEKARRENRLVLNEVEAKQLLSSANVPVTETRLAPSAEQAATVAGELGYPVALKIVSPQITHKSDVGGVALNVGSSDEVVTAFSAIVDAAKRAEPTATIEGVSVQPMAPPGVEVIAGMTTDPQFGPVLMFGLGGVLVEVLKDVAFRIVPIEAKDAKQMIREIKGFPVLKGYRGQPAADLAALEGLLLTLSTFIENHPEIAELDLNPVFAHADGATAVDARVVLAEKTQ